MLIVCPNCATSYQVLPESLGDIGRTVRCVSCYRTWFQPAPHAELHAPGQPAAELHAPGQPAGDREIDAPLIRPPLDDVVDIGADRLASGEAVPGLSADGLVRTDDGTEHEEAPSIVPAGEHTDPTSIDAERSVESAAARRPVRPKTPRRRAVLSHHALPASICALVLVVACLIAARQQIVRVLPQTASLYARIGLPVNLRGLTFENIKTAREMQDGVPMLVVEGDIVGTTGRHTEVPRLRLAVVDRNGKEIYAWTLRPSRTLLPPGEALPFRSRLASPPAEGSGVSVRFFNRHDAQAGFM